MMEVEQPDQLELLSYRRLLPPGHELFEEGDIEREEIVYLQSIQGNPSDEAQPTTDSIFAEPADAFLCSSCMATLPSSHLLDLHAAETHDSFFAAQAARRMKVFRCLVEGCSKAFTSIMERRQHLRDVHAFPTNYAFDRLHLVKKQSQLRPEVCHQKPSPSSSRGFKTGRDSARPGRRGGLASRGLVQGLVPEEAEKGEHPAASQSSVYLGRESGAPEGLEERSSKAEASWGAQGKGRGAGFRSRAEDMDIDSLSKKFSSAQKLLSQPKRGRGHRIVL